MSESQEIQGDIAQVIKNFNETVVAAYENEIVQLNTEDFVSSDLISQLEGRNDYIRSSQSAYDIIMKTDDFEIKKIYRVNDDLVKVLATRTISQTLSNKDSGSFPFYSSTKEGYILVNKMDGWKIARVVDEMYGANLMMNFFEENFTKSDPVFSSRLPELSRNNVVKDFGGVEYKNLPKESFEPSIQNDDLKSLKDPNDSASLNIPTSYMYSKANACAYALRWGGANRNPAYKDYSNLGGDCANFTSQCLKAGAMTNTNSWFPGSYQFINVVGQRDMLINTGRAKGFYQALPVYPRNLDTTGTVVHYSNGSQWYHAVIITQDPKTTYNNIRVTGHTANVINGPIWPNINQIRSFQVY